MNNNQTQSFIILLGMLLCFYSEFTFAADIGTVFNDVNTKTNALLDWVLKGLVYFIAVSAFIAWGVAMLFKKMQWVEGLVILLVIILIGSSPTIVTYFINK